MGAGSWGTALSAVLSKKGHDVHMWAFEPEVAEQITQGRENVSYLPGVKLPENLGSTADLATALQGAEIVVSVSPAQVVGLVMAEAAAHIEDDALIVSASKGIEITTLRRMDEVISEVLSPAQIDRFTVLGTQLRSRGREGDSYRGGCGQRKRRRCSSRARLVSNELLPRVHGE